MSASPYDPPASPIQSVPIDGRSWHAIWIGATVASGSGFLIGSFLGPFFQHWFAWNSTDGVNWYQSMLASPVFLVPVLVLSGCAYVYGGYIAAAQARSSPLWHSAFAALLCIAIGAFGYLGVVQIPLAKWAQIAGFAITIPCFLFGAKWQMWNSDTDRVDV